MAGTFGLTDQGYNVKRTADFVAALEADFATAFPGANLDPTSNLGQIIGIMALAFAEREEQNHALYSSMQLSTAEGVNLDQLGMLVGLARSTDATTGVDETDEDYRSRLQSIALANATPDNATSALCRTLKGITGVEYVAINQDTAAGSYEVVILGGDEQTIAESIYAYHPTGATINGTSQYDVTSDCGFCQRVAFTRPTPVDVCIQVEIEPSPSCNCDTSSVTPFETAIFNHFNNTGDTCAKRIAARLSIGGLYSALNTVGEIEIIDAQFSRDGGATFAPGPLQLANTEYAVYNRDCVDVTFAP